MKKMKSGFYYVSCDKCNKLQSLEKAKKDDPFHDDVDNDGLTFLSCTCGNIDIRLLISKIVLKNY